MLFLYICVIKGLEVYALQWIIMVVAGLLFVILLISGGLLNLNKPFYDLLQKIHRILPAFAIALTAVIFYLFLKK